MIDWAELDTHKFANETIAANTLLPRVKLDEVSKGKIAKDAVDIVRRAREMTVKKGLKETILEEFGFSNNEGLALMCLAESLLRVPDSKTEDKFIAEKYLLVIGVITREVGELVRQCVNSGTSADECWPGHKQVSI